MSMVAAYWFPDFGVTAVDGGGPQVQVFATGPTEAIGQHSPAVHVINVWDHAKGKRRPVTAETIRAEVTAWWHNYPDNGGGGGGEAA